LALRDNKVDEHSGLSPDGAKHMRSGSVTSSHSTIAANEADNHLLHPAATSAAIAKGGRSNSRGSGDTHAESHTRGDPEKTEDSTGQERAKLDLDNDIDPTPFKSKPLALASLLDPKDFDALIQLGGVDGLLRGLGTHPTLGLRKKALSRSETYKTRQEAAAGSAEAGLSRGEKSDPNDGPPGIVVTSPAGDVASGGEKDPRGRHDFDEDGPAYTATLDRRRQVYGENILPQRRSKTLLQLMWLAFKDKVLVFMLFSFEILPI
jgi:Ca2+-transporting ATPase